MNHVTLLLWALPVALSIHVFEEFGYPGGFTLWIGSHKTRKVRSTRYYVIVNAAAILGSIAIALFAKDDVGYCLYLYSAALMAGNAASHVRGAVRTRTYCPGSVTGGVVLIPLSLTALWFFLSSSGIGRIFVLLSVAAGWVVGYLLFNVDRRPAEAAE